MIQDISNRKSRWMAPPVEAKQEQPKSGRKTHYKNTNLTLQNTRNPKR